ncbi:MAG: hypothetical protein PHW52_01630 [Candidatus Pacebacteria bacterium]|nr:hypothetical protein [Candidatus Paceibacterota bacterium]
MSQVAGYTLFERVFQGSEVHCTYLKIKEYFKDVVIEEPSAFEDGIPMSGYIDIYIKSEEVEFIGNLIKRNGNGIIGIDDLAYMI